MTNAEAIEVLRNLEYYANVKIRDVEAIGLAIEALQYENQMRDKIHHVEYSEKQKETQKWIPVTERLPEKNGDYLVTVYENPGAVFIDNYDKEMSFFSAYEPTAWMPLPKPYKGENKDVN